MRVSRSLAARRALRTLGVAAVAVAGLTCRDQSLTGPPLPRTVALSLAPTVAKEVAGGPVIRLAAVRAVAAPASGGDSTTTVASFAGDSAVLQMELTVVGTAQLYVIRLAAVDAAGDTLYRAIDSVTVAAGTSVVPVRSPTMVWAAADLAVQQLTIGPRDTTISSATTLQLRATGTDASGAAVAKLYIGWTSRDTTVGTVTQDGVFHPGVLERSGWVVGRLMNGRADSVQISVRAPVAAIVADRDTAHVLRGSKLTLSAQARDAAGTPLTDRVPVWRAVGSAVTVTADGIVTGVVSRSIALVIAELDGKADTVRVTVDPRPVSFVTVAPRSASLLKGQTLTLTVQVYDDQDEPNPDFPPVWSSSDTLRAKVAADGVVTAIDTGNVYIRALAGGRGDSALVHVGLVPVSRVILSPDTATRFIGDSAQFTAAAYDSIGGVLAARPISIVSLDPQIATVSATGWAKGVGTGVARIVATAEGKADTSTFTSKARTALSVSPRTLAFTAYGDSATLVASVSGRPAGADTTITWVSRNSTIATVDASGRVLATGNGSTYVVATESLGASDSALVTVAQRVVSVLVTPNAASSFLGGTQQFTATAVDARGNAIPGTAFTWSSSATNVATIDASTGLASANALGQTTITATAGTIAGTATYTVASRIKLIRVTPDTATLTALGVSQGYTAVAYDSSGAALDIVLNWTSTNPSVATLSGTTGATNSATSVGNGVTSIEVSAQGVTGVATLHVQQVLSAIDVSPPGPVVAPNGGRAVLTARGRDANGHYLTGVSVTWSSDNTSVATVDAGGVVTGVAVGTAHVSATSGGITAQTTVTVSTQGIVNAVSFGRDTIAVGRGSQTSIPLYLSNPSPQVPITIWLHARDTLAYFPGSSPVPNDTVIAVTFQPGQTVLNFTLGARSAGTTAIRAVDSTSSYVPDTAFVTIRANASLSLSRTYLHVNEQVPGQVLLSDPAPAGGVYITFDYNTAGVAKISPDPAFIPAGQLAASVAFRGVGEGTTYITPVAAGVNGAATYVSVSPQTLLICEYYYYCSAPVVGLGQYSANMDYVHTPTSVVNALPITLVSSDSTILKGVLNGAGIPAGGSSAYYSVYGYKLGAATVTASSAGWTPTSRTYTVSSPHIGVSGGGASLNTSSPIQNVTISAQDSLHGTHALINSLTVRLVSTDTSVIKVLDSVATIAAGQCCTYNLRVQPNGTGGTAKVYAVVGGAYTTDTISYTVANPKLVFQSYYYYYSKTEYLAVGQYASDLVIGLPNAVSHPVSVRLTSSDSSIAALDTTLTIPTGATAVYFQTRGRGAGTAIAVATATGYDPDTATLIVTHPQVRGSGGGTLNMFQPSTSLGAYVVDSIQGNQRNLLDSVHLHFVSSDTRVLTVQSDTTIPRGNSAIYGVKVTPVGAGTAKVYVTAPGYTTNTDSSVQYTVQQPSLVAPCFYYYDCAHHHIGARQSSGNGYYVSIPNPRSDTVTVSVTQHYRNIVGAPATVKIAPGQTSAAFTYEGLQPGADTLVFSSPGYNDGVMYVVVTTPQLVGSGLPGSAVTTQGDWHASANAADSLRSQHYALDTVAVRVTSSNPTVLQVVDTMLHILKGTSSTSTSARVRFINHGQAYLIYSDSAGLYRPDTSNTVTVNAPSLSVSTNLISVGMHQQLAPAGSNGYGVGIYTPNAVTSDLVIYLSSSATSVAQVPATVTIPKGQSYAYVNVFGQSSTGRVRVKVDSAAGYDLGKAFFDVDVGKPQLLLSTSRNGRTTQAPGSIAVYTLDQTGQQRYPSEDVTVTLGSTVPTVAAPDSSSVVVTKASYYNSNAKVVYKSVGTTVITATDTRSDPWAYSAAQAGPPTYSSDTVTVSPPALTFNISNGATMAPGEQQGIYLYLPDTRPANSPLTVTVTSSNTSVASLDSTQVTIAGGASTSHIVMLSTPSIGTASISASASGVQPTSVPVTVGTGMIYSYYGWPSTLAVGDSALARFYVTSPNGSAYPLSAATNLTLTPNANIEFHQNGQVVTSAQIAAGQYYSDNVYIKARSAGAGSAQVSLSGYQTLQTGDISIK